MKRLTFLVSTTVVAALMFSAAARADFIALNPTATVADEVVRMSDLFVGAGEKADLVVAYAPELGRRAVFDAAWLTRLARSQGLNWRAQNRFDRVVVTRASQVLNPHAITSELSRALSANGAPPQFEIEFASRLGQIHLPLETAPTLAIQDLRYDTDNGRFSAVVTAPADAPTSRISVAGRLYEVVDIPVPVRRLGKGEVIGAGDIAFERMRIDRMSRDMLVDESAIVGMTPRRGLMPNQPVRASDVRAPVVVEKGGLVTMTLRLPTMVLTARGRAAEDGSMGQTIRVTNTSSHLTIEAQVVGLDQVVVGSNAQLALIGD